MTAREMSAQEVRQELYDRVRRDAPFEEKADDALELGRRYLDADNGHLTQIDLNTDHWEAIISTDSEDGQFPEGLQLDLASTYCRRTVEAQSPIALHDAPNQGWADDPAFEEHGLRCYHGTTLVVDEEPFGTVCFVGNDSREQPFGAEETMFIELLTRLLEQELEREQHETQLTRQTKLVRVLNRVLRHNVRNDMSIIRGYTQLLAEEAETDTYGRIALRNIDDLVELCEKARELDHVISDEYVTEWTDITALLERVVTRVATRHPEATIAVADGTNIEAAVLPGFERAIEELVENAAKHAGECPTVTVSIETVPNAIEVRVADDGPGLADIEAKVLTDGEESSLTHGDGLGLWLVYWIVTSHDGSIDATTTEGTTMTVTVPRKPGTAVREWPAPTR